MNRTTTALVTVSALALLAAPALALSSSGASESTAESILGVPVTIDAELDCLCLACDPSITSPAEYRAERVITDGPELTGMDWLTPRQDWQGDIKVDINPEAQTITVDHDQISVGLYRTIRVQITTTSIASAAPVSDGFRPLQIAGHEDEPLIASLETGASNNVVSLTWTAGENSYFAMDQPSVFSYTLTPDSSDNPVVPVPTDTPAPVPTGTPVPPAPVTPAPVPTDVPVSPAPETPAPVPTETPTPAPTDVPVSPAPETPAPTPTVPVTPGTEIVPALPATPAQTQPRFTG